MSKTKLRVLKPGDVVKEPPQARNDGWHNLMTLLGTSADKRTGARLHWEARDPQFYEDLYGGGGVPARIVDLVPEEALREWLDWTNVDNATKEMVEDRCEELDVRGALLRSWKWGRAYGGGCLHIVTDTRDPSAPLRRGEKVIALRDFSRWDLRILTTDVEYDLGSVNYGCPRIYYLNVQMGSQYKGYPIHWTRMIRFDGQLVPRRTYIRNNYWHDSILNRLYDTIRDYQISNDAVAACLQDFNVDVFGMKDLANLISSGKEDVVRARMEILAEGKSVLNAMMLDADSETYDNKARALEGVAELLVHQANRLVAETDIPHTKLLGESPDGSNSTGNSTSQMWNNFLSAEQQNYLRPKVRRLKQIIFPDQVKMSFKFRALRKLDDLETADLRNKQSQTDKNYVDAQVLDPSEIAKSRFGGEEYSLETELDEEARDAGLIGGIQPPVLVDQNGNPISTDPDDVGSEDEGGETEEGGGTGSAAEEAAPGNPGPDNGGQEGQTGDEYAAKHSKAPKPKNAKPATEGFITQTMSDPMRDPKTDPTPKMKGPGIPNKPRTFLPTRGTGITAPSGFDPEKDAGKKGTQQDATAESGDDRDAGDEDRKDNAGGTRGVTQDAGVEATMKEFAKGTLKSSSGKKVTDPKQALAIGYSEERHKDAEAPARKRASVIIVKRGDTFLMGRRRDTGRWTLPGGMVEERESMHQGGVRELAEETGLEAKRLKFLGSRLVEPKQGESVQVNLYEHQAEIGSRPTGKADPDREIAEFRWIPLSGKLPDDIGGNLQHPNNVALAHLGLLK